MDRITVPFGEVRADGPIDLNLQSERVVRGGSSDSPPKNCRPAVRWAVAANTQTAANRSLGFRIVRDVGPDTLLNARPANSKAANRRPDPRTKAGNGGRP